LIVSHQVLEGNLGPLIVFERPCFVHFSFILLQNLLLECELVVLPFLGVSVLLSYQLSGKFHRLHTIHPKLDFIDSWKVHFIQILIKDYIHYQIKRLKFVG